MSDNIRKALDAYAATETDAFINAFHFVDGGVWQDIEEEADRYNRQDVAPAPFAALRAVLDLHTHEEIPNFTVMGRPARACKYCGLTPPNQDWCPTVTAIAAALGVEA